LEFHQRFMWNRLYLNPRALILFLGLIVVWGILSLQTLPRMEDPALSPRSGVIVTDFPGANAERVESLVTQAIEQELLKNEAVAVITSDSRFETSTLILDLKEKITDPVRAWAKVRDQLDDIGPSLPEGTLAPIFDDVDLRAYSLVVGLRWQAESPANFAILKRLAKNLQTELRGIQGTEDVDPFASPSEEILVEANASKLSSAGLTPQDLAQQLFKNNSKTKVGQINSDRNTLRLDLNAERDSLNKIRSTTLDSGNNSQQTIVGDLSVISKGIQDPPRRRAYLNGKPGIAIAARIAPDVRIDQWIKSVNQTLEQFRQQLPEGVELVTISDQSQYVKPRIDGLFNNLILGVLCVFLTTLIMMGWRASLAVSSVMPLTAFIVFGGMRILDISFDQISVTGLVMALGMLIDGAIVMGDEMLMLFKAGLAPLQAIPKAAKVLLVPSLASTLTTVISFMPIVLIPGAVGEFVRSIGISIILALLGSLVLSFAVVPALMGYLHPRIPEPSLPFPYHSGLTSHHLTRLYASILDTSLAKPIFSIVLCLIVPISGFFLATTLNEQFFPPTQRNQFHIEMELPGSASFQATEATTLKVQHTLMQHPDIEQVNWFIGQYAPAFYYNLPRGGKTIPNFAHGIVQTKNAENNPQLINSLQEELDQTYPEAQILVRALEQGPYIPAPIEVHVSGADLEQLRAIGDRIRSTLNQIAGVTYSRTSLNNIVPQVALNIDQEQVQLAGLDNLAISQQLSANLDGVSGGSILEGTEEIPIRVKLADANQNNISNLGDLELLSNVQSPTGERSKVLLSTLSNLELQPEDNTITRRNGVRVNTVQGFLSTDILPSQAQRQLKTWVDQNIELPPGYTIQFGGEAEKRDGSVASLLVGIVPLIVIMLATLVLSFRSFRGAAIIVIVGILSLGLGFFSLAIFDYPLGFMAILGMVSMVGMAINDSIVTLSALKEFPEHLRGDRLVIRNVILRNTRHILTTTLTTVAGFIPLFLDGGLFWPPLVVCIAGGVTGATALSIFFVPNLYLLMFRPRSVRLALPEHRQIS
jgi:multidrug efflux pump subunit AcrB